MRGLYKNKAIFSAIVFALAFSPVFQPALASPTGEQADYNTPNPTGSPEVNEGAAQQREEYFARQDQEHQENYDVDSSGDDGKDDFRYKPE